MSSNTDLEGPSCPAMPDPLRGQPTPYSPGPNPTVGPFLNNYLATKLSVHPRVDGGRPLIRGLCLGSYHLQLPSLKLHKNTAVKNTCY